MDTCNCENCPHRVRVAALLAYLETSRQYVDKLEEYQKQLERLNATLSPKFNEGLKKLKH